MALVPYRRTMHGISSIAIFAALLLVAVACGTGADEAETGTEPPATTGTPAEADPATEQPTTTAEPTAADTGGQPQELTEVTYLLPFLRSIAFWPVHIAEEVGYFEEEGLQVASEATDGSSFVVQQVAAGAAEFGIATAAPVFLGYQQNENFQTVYDFLTGNVFDTWVVADSTIESFDTIESGSTIAVKDLAGGEIPLLNVQLQDAGLEPDVDVQLVQFGENPAVGAELLASGEADAMTISWNSLIGVLVALEEQGVELRCITCDPEETLASESVIVPTSFIEENPDLVVAHGRALAKATLFGTTNPAAALDIMRKVNPEEQVDQQYAVAYFEAATEIMRPRQPTDMYGFHDVGSWERYMELLLAPDLPSGLSEPIDVEALVNNDLVEEYNNFDHEAVIQQAEEWPTEG